MRCSAISRALFAILCAFALAVAPVAGAGKAARGDMLAQADEAIQALHWSDAVAILKKLVVADPSWRAYQKLGHAQFNLGQYQDAIAAFSSAVDQAKATADDAATRLAVAQMLTEQGNVYLRLRNYDAAMGSYKAALPFSDTYAVPYFNVCALDYNQGKIESAVADCDAAIKADGENADAYFIKGSILFGNTKMDAQGKMAAPPDAVDALNMYLKLAPDGPHVADVRAMLDSVNPGPSK